MTIQKLELTIRIDGIEHTLTTQECLEGRIWELLADNYTGGPDSGITQMFNMLKQLQEETAIFKETWEAIEDRGHFLQSLDVLKSDFEPQP